MRYLLAILLPPVAIISCGKTTAGILNLFLCLLGWIPGAIHAIRTVSSYYADRHAIGIIRNRAPTLASLGSEAG